MDEFKFPLDQKYFDVQTSGCDEVGRGCLAGPVVTACLSWIPRRVVSAPFYRILRDSKEMSETQRMQVYRDVLSHASRIRVAVISNVAVDQINVLRASLLGFEETAPEHGEKDFLFVDGNQQPPRLRWAKTVIKGENKLSAIAGASVVAKVIRDEWMHGMAGVFPGYGFENHVGYPTALHKRALQRLGPCPLHRKSFKPLHGFVPQETLHRERYLEILAEHRPERLESMWREYAKTYFEFCSRDDTQLWNHYQATLRAMTPTPEALWKEA